jgi:hypothetical protein
MNTILKLCFASALFFSISQPLAHASLCGEGVPEGTLQVQLDFLIACEPASGPQSAGLQARQDGNGSTHSPGSSGGPSVAAGFGSGISGDGGQSLGIHGIAGPVNRNGGGSGGGASNAAAPGNGTGSGNGGNDGAGSGNGQGSTADDAGRGDHGKRGQGNNGLGNGGGDGSPNGKDDNKR